MWAVVGRWTLLFKEMRERARKKAGVEARRAGVGHEGEGVCFGSVD